MARDNGAQFQEKSDIDNLISVLKNIEINTEHKVDGSIPNTPKYEDFVKNLGNLDLIVPMGFVMLHNDLEKLYGLYKNSNGVNVQTKSGTEVSVSTSAIVGTIGAVAGSTIVAGLVKDMSLRDVFDTLMGVGDWVISKLPEIGGFVTDFATTALPALASALAEATNNIGSGLATTLLNVKDLIADEELTLERKALLKTYLNLYYSQTFEDMGFSIGIDKQTGEILSISKAQERNYFEGLDSDAQLGEILSTGAQAILNEGINQAKNGELGATIGKNITGMTTGAVQAWADLAEEEAPQIALMGSQIFDMFEDEDIKAEIKRMNKLYVQAYFGGMINNMDYEVDFSTGELTKSIKQEKDYFADVDTSTVTSTITGSLTTVFNTALNQFSDGTLGTNIGKATGGFLGGQVEAIASSIGNSITSIASGITSLQMLGDGPSDKVKEAYGYYMQAYYANMIAGLGYDIDFTTGTLTRAVSFESVKTTVLDTVGDIVTAPFKWITSGVTNIVSDVSNSIAESDMRDELRESVINYVTSVYTDASSATETIDSAKNFAQTYFDTLNEQVSTESKAFKLTQNQISKLNNNIIDGFKSTTSTLNTELATQVEVLSTYDDTELRKDLQSLIITVSQIKPYIERLELNSSIEIVPAINELKNKNFSVMLNNSNTVTVDNTDLNNIV